jgi:GT2 family glycosyltransferase
MTDVDVIVLDLDGGPMLAACLASIAAQTVQPRRVIVFDNGSRTPTAGATFRSERNLGFAGGVNAAVRHATAPLVALINNDVVLDADWLETVLGAMDERTAAVQTILRTEGGAIDGAGIDIRDGTYRQIRSGEAWGVSATATLYRRELLRFDERFFAYYEDVELCARLHEAGWQTKVVQEVKATHKGSQSARHVRAKYLRTRNRYWVARLHPGVGSIASLMWEDAKLLLRGRSSLRGMIAGLFGTMNDEG